MSFFASAGRIIVTDGSDVVFDTDEQLFTATDGPLRNSVSIPQRQATRTSSGANNYVDLDSYTALQSINASADTIRGAFKVTTASAGGVSNIGWFNASGSYIHMMRARNAASTAVGNWGMPSIVAYTFIASAGTLYFHERVRLESDITSGVTSSITLFASTIDYYLFAGTFV